MYILDIAKKYIWGNSRINAVNYVALISLIAISIVSFSLVTVLSVYNGYVDIINEADKNTDPPLMIEPLLGSVINTDSINITDISSKNKVEIYPLIYSQSILNIGDRQIMSNMIASDSAYYRHIAKNLNAEAIDRNILGNHLDQSHDAVKSIVGLALISDPKLQEDFLMQKARLVVPKRKGLINPLAISSAFSYIDIEPEYILPSIREDIDNTIFIHIDDARYLLSYEDNEVNKFAVLLQNENNIDKVKSSLQASIGDKYIVKDRGEQRPEITLLIKTEKMMTYVILIFVLMLSIFNVSSCIIMMIIEKKDDILVMRAIGMSNMAIKNVFRISGMIIAGIGNVIGVILGLIFSYLQMKYGFINSGDVMIERALPMNIEPMDIVISIVASLILSYLMLLYSSKYIR